MKKGFIILFPIIATALCSCGVLSNDHVHEWDAAFDNGDGTHTMICHTDSRHSKTEAHIYGEGHIIKEATESEPGIISYICKECGNAKLDEIKPSGQHVYDQEVVDEKYKYTDDGYYTNVYYKSDKDGSYGDSSALFENTAIPEGYSEIEYIKNDGEHAIDTGIKNSNEYLSGSNLYPATTARIPFDYQEVEYIEGTGTQYIDTGLRLDYTMNIHLVSEIQYTKVTDYLWSGANIYAEYSYDNFKRFDKFKMETLFYDGKMFTLKANDEIVKTRDYLSDKYKNVLLGIFKCGDKDNTWWTVPERDLPNSMRVFNQTITINGIVERDFVPCYKKDTKEAGLYDLITKKFFGNIGSSEFLVGPEKRTYSRLPSDYVEVEYIEGTGTQYIDTGLRVDNTMTVRVVSDIQYTQPTDYYWAGAQVYAEYTYDKFQRLDKFRMESYFDENKVHTIKANDELIKTSDCSQFNFKNIILGIFKLGDKDNTWWTHQDKDVPNPMRVFNQTITINGNVERDYVPCYKKDTLEAGLFDLVTNEFYGNLGTDNFLCWDPVIPVLSPGCNEGNIKIFGDNTNGTDEVYKLKLFNFVLTDQSGTKISEFVTVKRDSDEKPGFLDIISKKFIEMPSEGFEAGTMVGHIFEEKITQEPTYNKDGVLERKCKLCGKTEHLSISRLAYQAVIAKDSNVLSVDVYRDYATLETADASIAYTRSSKTYNYSKVNAIITIKLSIADGYEFDCIESSQEFTCKEKDGFILL